MIMHEMEKVDREHLQDMVIKVLADKINVDHTRINPESFLIGDLGMDSFIAVELVFALEEQFGMQINGQDAQGFSKVSDIVEYIGKRWKT